VYPGTLVTPEAIGTRVRRVRMERGMTQARLAHLLGVTRQQVNNLERGSQRTMHEQTLGRYAKALGVSEHYLFTGIAEPPELDGLPALEIYLRQTSRLSDENIAQVARIVRSLEAEQQLARILAEQEDE
jgi:transcriptional regulator with XRE-family HTH domain